MLLTAWLAMAEEPVITLAAQAGNDASARIGEALSTLRRRGGGRLVLAAGRYACRATGPGAAIRVHDLAGITIQGEGAELVGCDPVPLLVCDGCRDLTIRGLRITWEPLPHSFGRVAGIDRDARTIDLAIDSPGGAIPGRRVQALFAYDAARERLADNAWEVYQVEDQGLAPTSLTGEGRLRVAIRKGVGLPQPGWDLVLRHQVYGLNALNLSGCSGVVIESVEVLAAPGMALYCWNSRDITVRRLQVHPAPGCHHSTTADAMHFNACRGTVVVEDSDCSGMGDDALNIHGLYGLVAERLDATTLAVQRGRWTAAAGSPRGAWDAPLPGDTLEAGGGDQPLLPTATLTVAEARPDAARRSTIVRFREPLPDGIGAGSVLANISALPAVRVRRCTVRGNRARGMLLQTRDVVIEDCRFTDISGAALHLCADAREWWEGPGVREVTLQRCIIERCNFGVARRAAAIDIFSDLAKGRQSAAGVHRGIRILDCTFTGNRGADIHVGSAIGVEIGGNRFEDADIPAVSMGDSRQVSLHGNRRPAGGAAPALQMGAGIGAGAVTVADNQGF